jgi:hypothetical protein
MLKSGTCSSPFIRVQVKPWAPSRLQVVVSPVESKVQVTLSGPFTARVKPSGSPVGSSSSETSQLL